jgi:hypothetical protein
MSVLANCAAAVRCLPRVVHFVGRFRLALFEAATDRLRHDGWYCRIETDVVVLPNARYLAAYRPDQRCFLPSLR